MEDIKDIINSVVKGCHQGGQQVSEVLAAYTARTIVEGDSSAFSLDRAITQEKKDEVILRSIQRLLERDNPALEMIKMQVDFDSSYLQEESEAQKKLKSRNKQINTHKQSIIDVVMQDSGDYEALTTLYRKIFKFLLEFAPNTRSVDKVVEREVAAALESVFPRVGLKTFIQLPDDDKVVQLMELARIVLGIRLFNRDEGRGGAGIQDMDKDSVLLANVLLQDIEREIEFFDDACTKYQQAIIRAHIYRRKKKFIEKAEEKARKEREEEEANGTGGEGDSQSSHHVHHMKPNEVYLISQMDEVNDAVVERWNQELGNRRQYLGFLRTLEDEARNLHSRITTITEKIKLELVTVKSLVNNKSSVPKELVYPRFDALGGLWLNLYEEVVSMVGRSNTFQVLCKYRLSFSPTLSEEIINENEENAFAWTLDPDELSVEEGGSFGSAGEAKQGFLPSVPSSPTRKGEGKEEKEATGLDDNLPDSPVAESKSPRFGEAEGGVRRTGSAQEKEGENKKEEDLFFSGVQLLSVEDTPDFMLLPLEFQGFCPWTIVEAKGLLLPGKPNLGIVRYHNLYYVFDHLAGQKAFMRNPDYYLHAIKERALRQPEYIHLLRLHRWFPTASLARLLQRTEIYMSSMTGQPLTRDAATETPTHFNEGFIDLNYHWNEWELRRRALKMVKLKHCKTSAMQTDLSHFKRDNETQVYEQREKDTQTRREKGVNPPIVTTYVQGFRGQVVSEEKAAGSSAGKNRDEKGVAGKDGKEFKARKMVYPGAGLVTLKMDL